MAKDKKIKKAIEGYKKAIEEHRKKIQEYEGKKEHLIEYWEKEIGSMEKVKKKKEGKLKKRGKR